MQLYTDQYGLQNAADKAATFRGLLDKWKGLTADLDPTDQAALATVYWDEILSKLDYATYGLN